MNIYKIIEMLNAKQPEEIQRKGIELAIKINCINCFIKPIDSNTWNNCTLILENFSNKDLYPYSIELLEWLKDIEGNAKDRLLKILARDNESLKDIEEYIKISLVLEEKNWTNNLLELKKLLSINDK